MRPSILSMFIAATLLSTTAQAQPLNREQQTLLRQNIYAQCYKDAKSRDDFVKLGIIMRTDAARDYCQCTSTRVAQTTQLADITEFAETKAMSKAMQGNMKEQSQACMEKILPPQ